MGVNGVFSHQISFAHVLSVVVVGVVVVVYGVASVGRLFSYGVVVSPYSYSGVVGNYGLSV